MNDWQRNAGPRPRSDDFPAPVPPEVHRCPYCRTPAFIGRLGPGTIIEVQCRRKQCRGNYVPFRLIAM